MSRSAKGNYNRTFQSCDLRDRLKAYKESKKHFIQPQPKNENVHYQKIIGTGTQCS